LAWSGKQTAADYRGSRKLQIDLITINYNSNTCDSEYHFQTRHTNHATHDTLIFNPHWMSPIEPHNKDLFRQVNDIS